LAGLREFGLKPGEIVVLLIQHVTDFVPAYWACLRGGFVAAPLMSAARERSHQPSGNALRVALSRLHNAMLVTDESFAAIAANEAREHGLRVLPLRFAEAKVGHVDEESPYADPLCLVPSSGSTGRLKLVALSHESVLYRNFVDPFQKRSSYLGTVALDSVSAAQNGIFLSYGSWTQMSAEVLTARPTSLLDAIERYHISAAGCIPSTAKTIVACAQQVDRQWDLGSLTLFGVGAETVPFRTLQILGDFLEESGSSRKIIRAGYGTTETGYLVTGAHPLAEPCHEDDAVSLGTSAPGVELRIVGDNDEMLDEGEVGQVLVNCPKKIFLSYWGEPDATRNSFTADGWWRTGDLGRLQDGALSLHGRAKDVLVVSGRKFPLAEIDAEIESVLSIGDRAFSCAVHWPGEATERLAVVFVARDRQADRRAELAENIRRVVSRRFGLRPRPVVAASLEEIPFAANGKLRRTGLSARIRSGAIAAAGDLPYLPKPHLESKPIELAALEQALAGVWREVLDLAGELDKNANFFDLGGDSLRSLMLYTAIEERFGQQISAETFFRVPSFAGLLALVAMGSGGSAAMKDASGWAGSSFVPPSEKDGGDSWRANLGTDGNVPVPWPLPAALRNRLLAPLETWSGARPTRSRLVLGLNTAGDKPPLFWVFNERQEFSHLARVLGPTQPLYGFRSGVEISDCREDDIQAFALRYISEIIEVCPDGPFFIGGNCQGAIIALAIAQHALRRQYHVPLLILMDWSFDLQPYGGRVLFVSGRDDVHHNANRQYARPELALRRAFANFDFVEVPGGYAFDRGTIAGLGGLLATHMQTALSATTTFLPACAYRASITADGVPARMKAGERRKIKVTVKNESGLIWRQTSGSGLMLGSRWTDPDGDPLQPIYEREPLPEIEPNAYAAVRLGIIAPSESGHFKLHIDVSEEGNRWFNKDPQNALSIPVSIGTLKPHFLRRAFNRLSPARFFPTRIRFSAGAPGVANLGFGWSRPEGWGTWSDGPRAKLRLPVSDRYGRWRAVLTCRAFGAGDKPVSIYVRNGFDGKETKWELPPNSTVRKEVELECSGSDITLQFLLPEAISPRLLSLGADRRQLGLGLIKMKIVQ
jgi:acyl-coenzyme A synthetase/AMP-(fatty) acid ligase/acyl carrier protein